MGAFGNFGVGRELPRAIPVLRQLLDPASLASRNTGAGFNVVLFSVGGIGFRAQKLVGREWRTKNPIPCLTTPRRLCGSWLPACLAHLSAPKSSGSSVSAQPLLPQTRTRAIPASLPASKPLQRRHSLPWATSAGLGAEIWPETYPVATVA